MEIRPVRIAVGAVVMEFLAVLSLLLIFPLAIRAPMLTGVERDEFFRHLADWVGPIGAFVFGLVAAWWVARKLAADHVGNGLVLGAVASVLYVAFLVALDAPFRWIFVVAIAARLTAGMAGGSVAGRRARARAHVSEIHSS